MSSSFQESIEEIKAIEKNAVPFEALKTEESVGLLQLKVPEIEELSYADLVNQYEKVEKILSIYKSGMLIRGSPAEKIVEQKVVKEIEIEMQKNTQETLVKAQEIAQVKEAPKPETTIEIERDNQNTIEFEKPSQDKPQRSEMLEREDFTQKKEEKIEIDTPIEIQKAQEKEEKIQTPNVAIEKITGSGDEKRVPEFLESKPSAPRIVLPANMGEKEIKMRMLELTKQLFKEKITSKKEEIKTEISMLKRLLSGEKIEEEQTGTTAEMPVLLDAVLDKYNTEANAKADEIDEKYNDQLNKLREDFWSKMNAAKNDKEKKEEYEKLVTQIKDIIEKIGTECDSELSKITTTEKSELSKIKEAAAQQEKINSSIKEYTNEFEAVKIGIAKELDALIDNATAKVFGESSIEDSKGVEVIEEIDEMTPTALLNYLKANKPEIYKKYEKKALSKSKAVLSAKIAIAKEKGVDKKIIDKYFPEKD